MIAAASIPSLSKPAVLPRASLNDDPPPYEARRLMSYACATRWGAMPVAYDLDRDQLTVAVQDAAHAERIANIYRFLMQPQRLAFCAATEKEIAAAFALHFGNPERAMRRWLLRPVLPRKSGKAAGPRRAGARKFSRVPTGYAYDTMSRALIGAVTLLASRELGADKERSDTAASRVRYCQMLARRMSIPAAAVDALVIAAWLSALRDPEGILEEVDTPYPLAEILRETAPGAVQQRAESRILALVAAYQEIAGDASARVGDVATTRRRLRQRWHPSEQGDEMLETFLQILMDEAFLTSSSGGSGRVLVVDSVETTTSLAPPLRGAGYDVSAVRSRRAALGNLERSDADLVIVSRYLADDDGLALCRDIKDRPEWESISVLVLLPEYGEDMLADALRAGADDALARPGNAEVLLLKVQRVLARVSGRERTEGISGTLHDMSFPDVVQILSAGGGKTVFDMMGAEGTGRVCIEAGDVVHVEAGDATGEEAFYALMRWEDGTFTARHCDPLPSRTMRAPVQALLMEGARRMDEAAGRENESRAAAA